MTRLSFSSPLLPSPPPCVHSTRPRVCVQNVPRVYRQHAHMYKNMWACCRYTRGHFERTHGDVLNAHTEVFQRATPTTNTTPRTTPNTHTPTRTQHAHTNTHTTTHTTRTHPTRTHQHAHKTHTTRTHQHNKSRR